MDDLLRSIVVLQGRLHDTGIPSIVIGGIAVATWREPRVTRVERIQAAHPSAALRAGLAEAIHLRSAKTARVRGK